MNTMATKIFVIISFLSSNLIIYSETKYASELLNRWIKEQLVLSDLPIKSVQTNLNSSKFINDMRNYYENHIPILRSTISFLKSFTCGQINENGHKLRLPITKTFTDNLNAFYNSLEDIPKFIELLKKNDFVTQTIIEEEQKTQTTALIEKYNALIALFLQSSVDEYQLLFAVSNRFFEFCFSKSTFSEFEQMIFEKENHPIVRFLYSVLWRTLASLGWQHWHENNLNALKEKADQSNRIIYIAGGSDIYQMLKKGIYNVTIIDPQLPSQPRYYAEGWNWLLCGDSSDGGIGDKIILNFDDKIVKMERVRFNTTNRLFKAPLASKNIIHIQQSTTEWAISENNQLVGSYIFERRFVEQNDFEIKANQVLLMSMNELYFVALPNAIEGWGIDTTQFAESLEIYIKQLRRPVDKNIINNIRLASLLNVTDLKYIALGTCVN